MKVVISDLVAALFPISVLMAVIVYGVVQAKNGDLARVTVSEAGVVIKPRGVFTFLFLSFRCFGTGTVPRRPVGA
ncbi:hypothetical protein [Streptosporangium subroseum]|uniref:hypothetical protein n=1 Tax=Streptosporangium subroseum TaxID=106412 RepID=UPI0030931E10|nr:hypothetical protein OHB15_36460 [Streptosporangium subroseum]